MAATAILNFFRCQFWLYELSSVVAVYIPAKVVNGFQPASELLRFVEKFNMAAAAILEFVGTII